MITVNNDTPLVQRSARLAETLLQDSLPERWQHTRAVAHRATDLAATVSPADREVLVAAAWLHDIGYALTVRHTGFHPIDGGLYLLRHGWEPRIAALVAHHSGARFVADHAGLEPLIRSFALEDGPVPDALTYADQTVGPWGRAMTINDRITDALTRHGPNSPTGQARTDRGAYLLAVADRVEHRRTADPAHTNDNHKIPRTDADKIHLFRVTGRRPGNATIKAPNDSAPAAEIAESENMSGPFRRRETAHGASAAIHSTDAGPEMGVHLTPRSHRKSR